MTDKSKRARILVIDDAPTNLHVLTAALSAEFQVQIATSGAIALELTTKHPPDLILLDVMMPEMNGFEVCKLLKAAPALTNIPVIFITAMSDSESQVAGLALGAADYVSKPFKVEIVKLRIRNLLER